MVLIEIRGDAWEVYKRSWALMGIRSHDELVRILEDDIEEKSISVIEDAESARALSTYYDHKEIIVELTTSELKPIFERMLKRYFDQFQKNTPK
jgi:hypothetical protein